GWLRRRTKTTGCGRAAERSHSPGCARNLATLGVARFTGSELPEIRFNDFAILGWHIASQLLHGLGPLFFGQLAPLLGQAFQAFLIDVPRSTVFAAQAVFLRAIRRTLCRLTAGLAAAGSATIVFVLVLHLFDEFVEAGDDLLLDFLRLRAAAGQLQP